MKKTTQREESRHKPPNVTLLVNGTSPNDGISNTHFNSDQKKRRNPAQVKTDPWISKHSSSDDNSDPEYFGSYNDVSNETSAWSTYPDDLQQYSIQPWRKLLWVQQPYPDNYVDDSFLSQMKQNSHVQQYSFWTLSSDLSGILAHLCTIAVFVIVFLGIYSRGWNPLWFAVGSGALTVTGYVFWRSFLVCAVAAVQGTGDSSHKIINTQSGSATTLKSSLLILFTLLALSPVLKSLTQSTSSDSIWALACWLLVANICFNDYSSLSFSTPSSSSSELRSILSTNLALSAAIVLASRLQTTISVFSFVLFSIQIFGVFPTFLRLLRNPPSSSQTSQTSSNEHSSRLISPLTYWLLLISLVIISGIGLFTMGGIWALVLWIGILFSVVVVLPATLLALQKYKKYTLVLVLTNIHFPSNLLIVKFKGPGILLNQFLKLDCEECFLKLSTFIFLVIFRFLFYIFTHLGGIEKNNNNKYTLLLS